MYLIAFKMLLADTGKFFVLVGAITFATLLILLQIGIFMGFMLRSTSGLTNSGASVWVADPYVEQFSDVISLPDINLYRVRSVKGVSWALPMSQSPQQTRLEDGSFKITLLTGVDAATFIGMPSQMIEGQKEDLNKADMVIVDTKAVQLFSKPGKPLKVGDKLKINSHEAHIAGIVDAAPNLYNIPYVYTTFERANEYAPSTRNHIKFIMVEPEPGVSLNTLTERIHKETGLQAMTQDQFFWKTIWWIVENTAIVSAFGASVLFGFVIGAIVSTQIFYLFILENLRYFGAIKAMGARNGLISRMLLLQTLLVAFVGYGLGVLITVLAALRFIANRDPPFYLNWQVLIIVFVSVLIIAFLAAFIGIRKISKHEVAEVFRE